MTTLLPTLDQAQLSRAISLLDEEWLQHDSDLGPVMPLVLGRGVGQDWHKAGTFRHHLIGVARTLTLWQQPKHVRQLGLLHSVYGNAHVDLMKFDPKSERGRLQEAVGEDAERLIYLFCVMSRIEFLGELFKGHLKDDGSLIITLQGEPFVLPARDVAAFIVVSMADICEQWYSWQDDIYMGYPDYTPQPAQQHWAAALWPGPMRPTTYRWGQISRLGNFLQHSGLKNQLPQPPVFDHGRAVMAPGDEAAAAALYWSVMQQSQPLMSPTATAAVLEQAIKLNPWVAEPYMVLSQLHMTERNFDLGRQYAEAGVQMAACWGNSWDKRIGWDGWMSWGRVLLQSAQKHQWPETLNKLNNVALTPEL